MFQTLGQNIGLKGLSAILPSIFAFLVWKSIVTGNFDGLIGFSIIVVGTAAFFYAQIVRRKYRRLKHGRLVEEILHQLD